MKRVLVIAIILLVSLVFTWTGLAQTGDGFDLSWFTVDGGGGESSGAGYALSGSVAQSDAGEMTGGDFSLVGGFWGRTAASSDYIIYLPLVIR